MSYAVRKSVRKLVSDRRGNVAILAAIAMPVLIGSLGVGAEVASWYGGKRGLQNAADSAAVAAATNGTDDTFDDEARAVAAEYGYRNGVGGVSVTAIKNVACPDGTNVCYRVTISRTQPIFLAQMVGFQGDEQIEGSPVKRLTSTALAIQGVGPREYCILALAGSGEPKGIHTNGAPFANLSGCNVMSNTDAVCNGHDLLADVGDAHGVNNGCGKKKNSNVKVVEDPYDELKSNIPDITCPSGYWKDDRKNKKDTIPTGQTLVNMQSSNLIERCGDTIVTGPVFITQPNTVLVIKNGSLNLDGKSIVTNPGASLTIIFTGNDQTRVHAPVGPGTYDFAAPDKDSTSPWKGVAMYQDPRLNSVMDVVEAGNSPTWNITGLVYMPHAAVTLSGAISKAGHGAKCMVMVVDHLLINGTGSILDNGECDKAGVDMPKGEAPARGELVS